MVAAEDPTATKTTIVVVPVAAMARILEMIAVAEVDGAATTVMAAAHSMAPTAGINAGAIHMGPTIARIMCFRLHHATTTTTTITTTAMPLAATAAAAAVATTTIVNAMLMSTTVLRLLLRLQLPLMRRLAMKYIGWMKR
jgi:hypothetical protein